MQRILRVPSYLKKYTRYLLRLIYVHNLPSVHPKFGRHYKHAMSALVKCSRKRGAKKSYTIEAILGALQAKNCGCNNITFIEFGVASGNGFRSLMIVANVIRNELNMNVKVLGFDNRTGLPVPKDFRDHPEVWNAKQFAMDQNYEAIDACAKRNKGELVIGDIAETLPKYSFGDSEVLAFASIDVDYYSSTKPITNWLATLPSKNLLPASVLYFDDVFNNWMYSQAAGEELAINEFNKKHESD